MPKGIKKRSGQIKEFTGDTIVEVTEKYVMWRRENPLISNPERIYRDVDGIVALVVIYTDKVPIADEEFGRGLFNKIALELASSEKIDIEALERKILKTALKGCDGNKTHAAKLVGLGLDAFSYRLKKYGITR